MTASPFLTAIAPLHIKFLLHAVAAPWPQMHFELHTTMAKQPMSLFADNPYPCTLSLKSEKFPLNLELFSGYLHIRVIDPTHPAGMPPHIT